MCSAITPSTSFYADNCGLVDKEHPALERLPDVETARGVFVDEAAMSKGATVGISKGYSVNLFGSAQRRWQHAGIAAATEALPSLIVDRGRTVD